MQKLISAEELTILLSANPSELSESAVLSGSPDSVLSGSSETTESPELSDPSFELNEGKKLISKPKLNMKFLYELIRDLQKENHRLTKRTDELERQIEYMNEFNLMHNEAAAAVEAFEAVELTIAAPAANNSDQVELAAAANNSDQVELTAMSLLSDKHSSPLERFQSTGLPGKASESGLAAIFGNHEIAHAAVFNTSDELTKEASSVTQPDNLYHDIPQAVRVSRSDRHQQPQKKKSLISLWFRGSDR